MKKCVSTSQSPQAIGPYSQAIQVGNFLFCSGQIPLRADGTLVTGDIRAQTKQVLENMAQVITAAGAAMDDVVKTTIFLTNLSDFQAVNEVYESYFSEPYPARSTIQVSALPKGVAVEIEAVVNRGKEG